MDPLIKRFEEEVDVGQPVDVLRWAADTFGDKLSVSTSFGVQGLVMIDMLAQFAPQTRIFSIDTGRLPEETYECARRVCERYGIKIDWVFPKHDSVELIIREKGLYSFRDSVENRKECCYVRKVEPLERALETCTAWITGRRRAHGVTRSELASFELDAAHPGKYKFNPLAHWGTEEVWEYVHKHHLPYNQLHDKGYTSIGCEPCTRSVELGEDDRAGRWWWEQPEHKECGLHLVFKDGAGI